MSKYEKCLTCKQLGDTCVPNLMEMETRELGLWCNELRKHKPWMTYDWIANETSVSKSAVHGFLTGAHADYRRETFRPIVKCIIGGKWADNLCGSITDSEKAIYEERIRQLEKELEWKTKTSDHFKAESEHLEKEFQDARKSHLESLEYWRKDSKRKNRIILALVVPLCLCLAVIIGALVIDKLDPEKGFFWIRSFLGGDGKHWWLFKG